MKIQYKNSDVIIGKRVTLGAVISSLAAFFAHFDPDNAPAYIAISIPVTFVAQVIVANWMGVTTHDE